jgi:hypothetical protein
MAESSEPIWARIPGWVKKIVPVLVSVGILYYYFLDQEWELLIDACTRADLWLAVFAIVIPQLVVWFTGTLIVERHFSWFHGPFPFWKYLFIHGSAYILMFVNTALGGGGLLLYQQRKAQITWRKLMGIVLFRIGLALFGLSVVMIPVTLAMYQYGLAEEARINMYVWWGFLIFGVVYLINSWMTWHHGTHFGISKIVVRDRESEFWTAFRTASKKQWFLTWAMIIPPLIITVIGTYFLNLAFDIHVPFWQFMVVGPLALAIMGLPIAFAGFGTATMAWMIFFGDYGSDENIAALTLFLPFGRMVCRSIIALVSLKPALEDISTLTLAPDEKEAQAAVVGEGD